MPISRRPPRRLVSYLAYTLATLTLLLLLLPQLVRQGVVYTLGRIGEGAVSVENVDINLFSGRLAVDELQIYQSGARLLRVGHAEAELDWHALWRKRIQLASIKLQNLSVTVEQPSANLLRIAGFLLPPAGPASASPVVEKSPPWGFGIERLALHNVAMDLIRPGLAQSLNIVQLKAGPLHSWQASEQTPLTAELQANNAVLKLDASATPFAPEPSLKASLQLDNVQLEKFQPVLPASLPQLRGRLSATLTLQLKKTAQQTLLHQSGKLLLDALQVSQPQQRIGAQQLGWQGDTSVAISNDRLSLAIDGTLKARGTTLALSAPQLLLATDTIDWQGKTGITLQNGTSRLTTAGNLAVSDVTAASDSAAQAHTRLAKVQLNAIELQGLQDIHIGQIQLAGLHTALKLTAAGLEPTHSMLGNTAATTNAPAANAESARSDEAGATRLRIDAIELGGDNRIRFADGTTRPAFSQDITDLTLTLGALDSQAPAQATPFSLRARLGKHSQLSARGELTPFARPFGSRFSVTLNEYEMPPLSPYLVRQLGYKINSGQLDSELQLAIADNTLQGAVQLKARQLEMEPEDQARIEKFEQQSNMPINTALGLLRDKDNNISLKIPLSGNLADPRFDLSDAINTALANTLRSAAVSYLKYLLQPYSSVISLVQLAGKAGGAVQLEPVMFAAGQAEPSPEMAGYIEKLAELFRKRDNLQLRLCGIATTADLLALSKGQRQTIAAEGDPALETLAHQRAERLKDILVDRYGVAAAQLFICHPTLDSGTDARPRVRLQL